MSNDRTELIEAADTLQNFVNIDMSESYPEPERSQIAGMVRKLARHVLATTQGDDDKAAARYRFLRDHKMRGTSPKMDGTVLFLMSSGWPALIGRDLDSAVDAAMEKVAAELQPKEPR